MAREIACPFCGFKRDDEYAIQLHIEEHHTEDSPFTILNSAPERPRTSRPEPGDDDWIKCTRPGCEEYLLVADVQEHLNMHEAIDACEDDSDSSMSSLRLSSASNASRRSSRDSDRIRDRPQGEQKSSRDGRSARHPNASSARQSFGQNDKRSRWGGSSTSSTARPGPSRQADSNSGRSMLEYFSGVSSQAKPPLPPRPPRRIEQPRHPGRLGTKELGPHAFEDSMPAEVRRRLLNDALPQRSNRIGRDGRIIKATFIENETVGLVPILADICARSRSTERTYFCHRSVRHVHKIRCEGNFCGYWNVQMMCSFLKDNAGDRCLLPNVLEIQDAIEKAWDNGICSYSRIETGGIRGTRKWIGTHDALAYFTQVGVSMQALSFKDEEDEPPAVLSLLDHLEAYFMSGSENAEHRGSSIVTDLPPVYFQRAGHSMTIVGLERKSDGHRNLIIFDPSFGTTRSMGHVLDGKRTNAEPRNLVKPYRRSDESLSRWNEFEILVPQPKKTSR